MEDVVECTRFLKAFMDWSSIILDSGLRNLLISYFIWNFNIESNVSVRRLKHSEVLIALYVDDLLTAGSDKLENEVVIQFLQKNFKCLKLNLKFWEYVWNIPMILSQKALCLVPKVLWWYSYEEVRRNIWRKIVKWYLRRTKPEW